MSELAAIGGFLLIAALVVWLAVKGAQQRGAAQEQAEQAKDVLDEVRKANEAMASVGGLSADDRRRELQRWARD